MGSGLLLDRAPVRGRRGGARAAGRAGAGEGALRAGQDLLLDCRFPRNVTPLKAEADANCIRASERAGALLDPPRRTVQVTHDGRTITAYYRAPREATAGTPVPGVLVMCGADVFKEDRGWFADLAVDNGMAALVVDAPGTGQNPFPMALESVTAWIACLDWLADRPEVHADGVGGLGISRGGHSVLLLAGSCPERVKAIVAVAGSNVGYEMTPAEKAAFVEEFRQRSHFRFGAPGDAPTFAELTEETLDEHSRRWSLDRDGVVDKITAPLLLINGKQDVRAPVGNIYHLLERGPVTGREARIYPDDGHCAPIHAHEWGPASFGWLREKLTAAAGTS